MYSQDGVVVSGGRDICDGAHIEFGCDVGGERASAFLQRRGVSLVRALRGLRAACGAVRCRRYRRARRVGCVLDGRFSFTAPVSGVLAIATFGSGFDSAITVYIDNSGVGFDGLVFASANSGCDASIPVGAFPQNTDGTTPACVQLWADAGTVFAIQVMGLQTGACRVHAHCADCARMNDTWYCVTACGITEGGSGSFPWEAVTEDAVVITDDNPGYGLGRHVGGGSV